MDEAAGSSTAACSITSACSISMATWLDGADHEAPRMDVSIAGAALPSSFCTGFSVLLFPAGGGADGGVAGIVRVRDSRAGVRTKVTYWRVVL